MVQSISRLGQLPLHEHGEMMEVISRVAKARAYNFDRIAYYEAHKGVEDLGVAVPPSMTDVMQAVGWPGLIVDALDERLNLRGMVAPGMDEESLGLDAIYVDNEIDQMYPEAHVDMMISGVSFLTAGVGMEGEPDPLITHESALDFSGIYDPRRRALTVAGGVTKWDNIGRPMAMTLYKPKRTFYLEKRAGQWVVIHIDEHGIDRPLVRRLVNRTRGSRQWGRSEITRPIISYTQSAMRTLLGAEVMREFFQAPQRYIMGADEKAFKDKAGNDVNPWRAYLGRFLSMTRDENGELPQVGEFTAHTPTTNIELVRMYSQLVAGEAGISAGRLGFVSENPTSADAIRADDFRHVARAERRQTSAGAGWRGIFLDALELREGPVSPEVRRAISCDWVNAATPTVAAAGDRAVKLVGSKVLQPQSKVLLKELGYKPGEIITIQQEHREAQGSELSSMLRAAALNAAATNPTVSQFSQQTRPVEESR